MPDLPVPPRSAFAAITRKAIEDHDEWDSPHWFLTLHWDGHDLSPRTCACITPDVPPERYPLVMAGIAREEFEKDPDDPAYGYLLQIEAHGMAEPGRDAGEAEREEFNRARIGRTFHKMPEAVECAVAYCADIHGRLWTAAELRAKPGEVSEHFYAPGSGRIGGQMGPRASRGRLRNGHDGPRASGTAGSAELSRETAMPREPGDSFEELYARTFRLPVRITTDLPEGTWRLVVVTEDVKLGGTL